MKTLKELVDKEIQKIGLIHWTDKERNVLKESFNSIANQVIEAVRLKKKKDHNDRVRVNEKGIGYNLAVDEQDQKINNLKNKG